MESVKRHLVLTSLIAIVFHFILLIYPQYFTFLFCTALAISLIVFVIFFFKRKYLYAVLFIFLILFSVINPYRIYVNEELKAHQIALRYQDSKMHCVATVTDSRHYNSYSVIFADITQIDGESTEKAIPARIGSYTAQGIMSGDKIEIEGYVQKSSDIVSPDFDTASYLRSKRIFIDIYSASVISSSSGKQSVLSKMRLFSRDMIYSYVSRNFDYETASVCYAMFAGDKDYVSPDTEESFRKSGLTHILCVSGMHLSIITGMFYSLFSFLSVHKRTKCILIIIICCVYTAFTGFSLSTTRACIMCILSFLALMSGRKTDAYSALFFSFLLISIISPYSVLDISLLLSFTSCLGIITFNDTFRFKASSSLFKRFLASTADSLFANLGAVLFTMPIVCYSFGGVSNLSVITTFIVMIPCQYLLTLLVILVLLFPLKFTEFLDPILHAIGFLCDRLCFLTISVSDFFAGLRYSYTRLDRDISALILCIYAICLIAIIVFISFGIKRAITFGVIFIINLGMFISFHSVYASIRHDSTYSVSYFRQNVNDRQLNIRLPRHGYLIVNADSVICDNKNLTNFDYSGRNNYLLIIPDKSIDYTILASSIKNFNERYGLKGIFVPESDDGIQVSQLLTEYGISCSFIPEKLQYGNTLIEFTFSDFTGISLNDGKTKTEIVYADNYDRDYFDEDNDICAFFVRETKDQFCPDTDYAPDCSLFYTRMPRNTSVNGIYNTFNKKSFYIKE